MKQRFTVKRVRDGLNRGKDKPGDLFEIRAEQFDDKHSPMKETAIIDAIGGSIGSRAEAERLAELLNQAWDIFYKGV